jgi:hypothetical protein
MHVQLQSVRTVMPTVQFQVHSNYYTPNILCYVIMQNLKKYGMIQVQNLTANMQLVKHTHHLSQALKKTPCNTTIQQFCHGG